MSLLLDALKRAEQEKLAKQGDRPEPQKARVVAAAPANEPSGASLELAPIQPAAGGAAGAPPAIPRDVAAAQNVFQAKEAAAASAAGRSRKGILLWLALAVLAILVAGAGIYVWLAVNSFTPRATASARPRLPAVAPVVPVQEGTPKLEIFNAPAQQPSAAIQPPAAPEATRSSPQVARLDAREIAAELLKDSAAPRQAPALKLAPSAEKPRVPNEVAAGYESLRAGDLAAARRSYAAAIAADAANVDARLGAATVEARSGNRMLAALHYRKALETDPRNATALAGLASIADFSQPDGIESQLRADITRSPQSPQLYFTLGNLYASQSRWNDAQGAFFEAHRYDPANADILYNLAVSLDHLGQTRLAADYYRRTLEAARDQATQFDPAPVARRLSELR